MRNFLKELLNNIQYINDNNTSCFYKKNYNVNYQYLNNKLYIIKDNKWRISRSSIIIETNNDNKVNINYNFFNSIYT
jgi:hypothetical protein